MDFIRGFENQSRHIICRVHENLLGSLLNMKACSSRDSCWAVECWWESVENLYCWWSWEYALRSTGQGENREVPTSIPCLGIIWGPGRLKYCLHLLENGCSNCNSNKQVDILFFGVWMEHLLVWAVPKALAGPCLEGLSLWLHWEWKPWISFLPCSFFLVSVFSWWFQLPCLWPPSPYQE